MQTARRISIDVRSNDTKIVGSCQSSGELPMHVRIRKSNVKRDKRGFRYRMKTKAGRKMINQRRRRGRKLPGHKKLRNR